MATITINVGPLTASRSHPDNAKVGAAFLAFYDAYNLGPPELTNQQKLERILTWFTRTVQDKAILEHTEDSRKRAEPEARTLYEFEPEPVPEVPEVS